MAVTKAQIFAAADALAAEGKRPTLESIRQITGGSYSTISPALNEWRARQAAKASPIREAAPQAVADRMAEVGAEIWAIVTLLSGATETQKVRYRRASARFCSSIMAHCGRFCSLIAR